MFHYFETHFTNCDAPLRSFLDLMLCKVARVFHPSKFLGMSDTAREDLAALIVLLGSQELAAMSSKKPAYIHRIRRREGWWSHGLVEQVWWPATRLETCRSKGISAFIRVSGAGFSNLNFMFSDLQTTAKADLTETTLLLRCNDPEWSYMLSMNTPTNTALPVNK